MVRSVPLKFVSQVGGPNHSILPILNIHFFSRLLLCVSVALSGMSVCFCIETEEAHNHDDVIYPEGEGEEGAAERVAGGGGARLTWWEEVIGWVAIVPDYATFVLLPTAVIALSIM